MITVYSTGMTKVNESNASTNEKKQSQEDRANSGTACPSSFLWDRHEFETKEIQVERVTAWMAVFRYEQLRWHVPLSELPQGVQDFFTAFRQTH